MSRPFLRLCPLLLAACGLRVDYNASSYQCDDGVCPSGFECSVDRVCVRPGGPDDAGADDARAADGGGTCSNGTVELGEQCDDGNLVDTDGCRNGCVWARCGDGVVRAHVEECDDGNTSSADACSSSCQSCSGVTEDGTGHCYRWGGVMEGWSDAALTCEGYGGYLASLTTLSEQQFTSLQAPGFPYWTGLNDIQTEGTYVWFNAEPVGSIPWDSGQPNGGIDNNDCIWAQAPSGELNDLGCTSATVARALCEIDGWHLRAVDNHAYRFVYYSDTASSHHDDCVAFGGDLASIDSAAEGSFLAGLGTGPFWVGPFATGTCQRATLGGGSATVSTVACGAALFAICEVE